MIHVPIKYRANNAELGIPNQNRIFNKIRYLFMVTLYLFIFFILLFFII